MEDQTSEGDVSVPVSQIILKFLAPGYADCEIIFDNVSAMQAVAGAWLLNKQAEVGFMQAEVAKQERKKANSIAVPKVNVVGNRQQEGGILKAK